MTKKQKIWLAIFGAMFLVPEILWGIVSNFYYAMLYTGYSEGGSPSEFHLLALVKSNDFNLFILFLQLIGAVSLFICLLLVKLDKKIIKWIAIPIIFLIAILVFYAFLFALKFNPNF